MVRTRCWNSTWQHDQSEAAKKQKRNTPKMQVLDDGELRDFGRLGGAAAHRLLSGLQNQRNRHAHLALHQLVLQAKQSAQEIEMGGTRRRLLVVFPMAERTTTGVSSGKLRMRSATSRIRSADASEEPPNFMTTVNPA